MRKTVVGRLDYCRAMDQWGVVNIDGQRWPLQAGQRVTLGDLQGVPIHAVLLRDGMHWTWAVTDAPLSPAEGGLVTMAVADTID